MQVDVVVPDRIVPEGGTVPDGIFGDGVCRQDGQRPVQERGEIDDRLLASDHGHKFARAIEDQDRVLLLIQQEKPIFSHFKQRLPLPDSSPIRDAERNYVDACVQVFHGGLLPEGLTEIHLRDAVRRTGNHKEQAAQNGYRSFHVARVCSIAKVGSPGRNGK